MIRMARMSYSITAESPLASETAMDTVAIALPPGRTELADKGTRRRRRGGGGELPGCSMERGLKSGRRGH